LKNVEEIFVKLYSPVDATNPDIEIIYQRKFLETLVSKILNLRENRKFPGRKRPNQNHVRITNNNNSAIVLTLNICLQFFFIDGYL